VLEDEMTLSDADKQWLKELIDRKIDDLLPDIWDSAAVDMIEHGNEIIRPVTALERLLKRG
jgi:hypothetical protein